jgi:methylenetetrahydrofolate--tRNA-(uracil-5-)-methyltransferase
MNLPPLVKPYVPQAVPLTARHHHVRHRNQLLNHRRVKRLHFHRQAPVVELLRTDCRRRDVHGHGRDCRARRVRDEAAYREFVARLCGATKVEPRSFEEVRYFEGCLPVEVMASRGELTLAFGPMKPVGLVDPRTGRQPFAVVQLRPEDVAATAYNLVGFQTRMTWPEQGRVLRTIPGLENAELLRFGSVHRNTFVDAPRVLDGRMQLRARPGVFLAGQITGVEGYVESCACGFVCAVMLAQSLLRLPVTPPPATTALGGVRTHLAGHEPSSAREYQPSNVTWAWLPPLSDRRMKKRDRCEAISARALEDLGGWLEGAPLAVGATGHRAAE